MLCSKPDTMKTRDCTGISVPSANDNTIFVGSVKFHS